MEAPAGFAFAMRPVQSETYDGESDFLKVNTSLYRINEYVMLIEESGPNGITYLQDFRHASRLLSGTASTWCYTVQIN